MQPELGFDLKAIAAHRKSLGRNQGDFWKLFGATQSGGSRYETGRAMPKSIAMLITLHALDMVTEDQLAQANRIVADKANASAVEPTPS
jgi:predicted transcriptional regulator